MNDKLVVLNKEQIRQKTERIAFEILENTFEEPCVFIVGIEGNGYLFAERLVEQLAKHTDQELRLVKIIIDKNVPLEHEIKMSVEKEELKGATVVLVDDVINSGRTMIHAVRVLLEEPLNMLKVATLVNRTHRRFPVQADFVGVHISTTLQDNIIVELNENEIAYLA
ncbi:phosphoribosyltransferase [Paracrocinitomix mangrovi]|uniref:phosphoribosyltransferase family protein n=1 Tax=Paracrocinitomix mangrovi TaxID=2862509 RepID=UPI001C8EB5F5|nr:phosphoribosyltransferase family protein [Paracrocinitomix mangrovi]UKN02791.1 phosphoribosyltransferase [Paracrocinitomix mangrovi]